MVPVFYSIDEYILTNITNITSMFSQFSPNPDWVRVPVLITMILDIMLPVIRIKQLSYIYNEKNPLH